VISLVPSLEAICLFSIPEITKRQQHSEIADLQRRYAMPARERDVTACGAIPLQCLMNRIEEVLVSKRLGEELYRAGFMPLTVMGMSPCAVMKMIGIWTPILASLS
jgi:hypothetical protein